MLAAKWVSIIIFTVIAQRNRYLNDSCKPNGNGDNFINKFLLNENGVTADNEAKPSNCK